MSEGRVTVQRDPQAPAVATVWIANPAKLNAMSLPMWRALHQHVAALDEDPSVRVLVLRGEGGKAFVSGADISGFAADRTDGAAVAAYDAAVQSAQRALAACSKPTVAAIEGVCMGGGIGLALACDLRYASLGSRLRMPAARLGLGYALPAMHQVVDTIGAARALDIFLTARSFDGAEARRIGLVTDAFDDACFAAEVARIVGEMACLAPLTLRAAKAAVRACISSHGDQSSSEVERLVRACFESADYREGQLAFRERRAPQFIGA